MRIFLTFYWFIQVLCTILLHTDIKRRREVKNRKMRREVADKMKGKRKKIYIYKVYYGLKQIGTDYLM